MAFISARFSDVTSKVKYSALVAREQYLQRERLWSVTVGAGNISIRMDNSMRSPIGVMAPPDLPATEFVEYAQQAERLGFAELWIVEDCFLQGGIAQAGIALASTSRIRVGIGILPAGARNVAFVGMDLSTICSIFPGRLIVGIGHGMQTWMRQTGSWPASPLTLLDEYISAMRAILSGETVTAEGRYVKLREVRFAAPPAKVPPIYAGVRGPKSMALSGRISDGTILAEPATPEYIRTVRKHIGKPGTGHKIAAYNIAAVDESPERARALARQGLHWIGEPEWAPHISPLSFAAEFASLRKTADSREDFANSLPDEWVDQLAVVGDVASTTARLAQLSEAGADHLILIPAGADPYRQMASLAQLL
ncbi:LLM class flavin-dependent oxidoreductase [Lacisediminihabitans sp. FW035]